MSTNDDSGSRRGRRADQGEPDWRAPKRQHPGDRWDQSPSGNRDNPYSREGGSENPPPPHAAYSGFTRPSYPQQRPEQAPPPPQQPRAFEPPAPPQGYYQEPMQRQEPPRYAEPPASYSPPPKPYEPVLPQHYSDTGRDDLFTREAAPLSYEQNPYPSQGPGYQAEPYSGAPGRGPLMQPASSRRDEPEFYGREAPPVPEDYDRGFAARIAAQESQASRFFLPEDQPQAPQPRPIQQDRNSAPYPPQAPMERGYAPAQQPYHAGGYDPRGGPGDDYGRDRFDPRFAAQESWPAGEQGFHEEETGGHPPLAAHDEFDEDYFADEDEFEQDEHPASQTRDRKKLFLALFAGAIVVAGGGGYVYKTMTGGGAGRGTPFIAADSRPSKEVPGNPGGKIFPHGDKAIYERLTPEGQTVASFAPPPSATPPAPVATAFTPPATGGSSLEDRIDEALRRAHNTGDAPSAPPRQLPDQPTPVHGEVYRPDGTRVDAGRPVITPNIMNVDSGLPYPFGNGTPPPPQASQPAPAPFRSAALPAPAQQQFSTATAPAPRSASLRSAPRQVAPAEPVPAPAAGGYYVSLKSSPDEKAIQRDIPALTEKYKSVLGDVQLMSKIADLGAKGVTHRLVAGPLSTQQEASELCQKIKGVGGDKACFVTK